MTPASHSYTWLEARTGMAGHTRRIPRRSRDHRCIGGVCQVFAMQCRQDICGTRGGSRPAHRAVHHDRSDAGSHAKAVRRCIGGHAQDRQDDAQTASAQGVIGVIAAPVMKANDTHAFAHPMPCAHCGKLRSIRIVPPHRAGQKNH
ncbi:hypothetical protein XALC_1238 [Xanthomonas albilineans GPE PC73]|uniref:Uncharacterized protein n=1 Tax=Xanthomonas albilineans (strain GPE PC73 / CFBP 7063) TaxID=380358 RepID=D2UA18_XANAP|nr:hypothetical protein XALC_1238 [Xanthomonas albilineans GPE PC73]